MFLGSLLVTGGVILFLFYSYLKKKFVLTEPIETLVELKIYDPLKVLKILDGFIKKSDEQYHKTFNSIFIMHYFWSSCYRYVFQNGNYIIIGLISISDYEHSVGVGIGYYDKNDCLSHAKGWQKKIDNFLSKKKLIELFKGKIR